MVKTKKYVISLDKVNRNDKTKFILYGVKPSMDIVVQYMRID
jgi:hypothetical protein